jgi:DtxR family Mn-dependent transcriptional regulator
MRTRGIEDTLKAICSLEEEGGRACTTALARRLGVSGASITEMLKRLSAGGLVVYEPYRGVALTSEGRRLARRTLRRHRLWEMFLARHLGFRWDEIHEEAERLEHATSDRLENRLDRALGFPRFDPHGDPIPSAGGALRQPRLTTLADAEGGSTVVVTRVRDRDGDALRYVSRIGISLNQRLVVCEAARPDGSLRILVGTREHTVSGMFARRICVAPADRTRRQRGKRSGR